MKASAIRKVLTDIDSDTLLTVVCEGIQSIPPVSHIFVDEQNRLMKVKGSDFTLYLNTEKIIAIQVME